MINIKYLLITIILLIIYKLIYKKQHIKYYVVKNYSSEPIYLFWTGGYDSTFRLCQAVLKEYLLVQPIYIIGNNLDNYTYKKYSKRNNVNHELRAMNKIKQSLFKKFPFTKTRILSTKIIKNLRLSDFVTRGMFLLYKKGLISRPVTQYGSMAQVSLNLNKNIEVCCERCENSVMCKLLYGKKYCSGNANYKINNNTPIIFKKFLFPISSYTKQEMLMESKQYGFEDILKKTWSCWFPKNNKPCGKCNMCTDRII
jgi:7-cyano-7-deazaguanine synthase in queuosine biosynthesis